MQDGDKVKKEGKENDGLADLKATDGDQHVSEVSIKSHVPALFSIASSTSVWNGDEAETK